MRHTNVIEGGLAGESSEMRVGLLFLGLVATAAALHSAGAFQAYSPTNRLGSAGDSRAFFLGSLCDLTQDGWGLAEADCVPAAPEL
jgi:hypothetical protein